MATLDLETPPTAHRVTVARTQIMEEKERTVPTAHQAGVAVKELRERKVPTTVAPHHKVLSLQHGLRHLALRVRTVLVDKVVVAAVREPAAAEVEDAEDAEEQVVLLEPVAGLVLGSFPSPPQ